MAQKKKAVENKTLLKLESSQDIKQFLEKSTLAFAEALTGILSPSGFWPSKYVLTAGHLIQAKIKGKLFHQLGKEIEKYRKEGRIKEDYFATNKNQASILELLQFIDTEVPDEEIFNAMKSIFFTAVASDADSRQEEMSYQLLLLCKKLNSMDILILKSCYRIYKGEIYANMGITAFGDWVNTISGHIGYDLPELVSAADPKLVDLGLLSPRGYSDKSGIYAGKEFRLTRLGIKLCEHITEYK